VADCQSKSMSWISENIANSEYRQHYYDSPEVTHELVVMGNTSGTLYYTSFYRKKDRQTFGRNEIGIMNAIAGFMNQSPASPQRTRQAFRRYGFQLRSLTFGPARSTAAKDARAS